MFINLREALKQQTRSIRITTVLQAKRARRSVVVGSHYHKLNTKTDFYENHYHKVIGSTEPAIPVGNGKHVAFAEGPITSEDGHRHEHEFAT